MDQPPCIQATIDTLERRLEHRNALQWQSALQDNPSCDLAKRLVQVQQARRKLHWEQPQLLATPAENLRLLKHIKRSSATRLYLVEHEGKMRCMKVFTSKVSDNLPSYVGMDWYEWKYELRMQQEKPSLTCEGVDENRFYAELAAYNNLQGFGVVEKGGVPRFFGIVDGPIKKVRGLERLEEDEWPEYWEQLEEHEQQRIRTQHDTSHWRAILLEYFEPLYRLDSLYYTPERWVEATRILLDIHAAGVAHTDITPRNLALARREGESELRVIIYDFDHSLVWYDVLDLEQLDAYAFAIDISVLKGIEDDIKGFKERGVPYKRQWFLEECWR